MATFQRFDELNAALMETYTETACREMLEAELARDAPRKVFALRIHSRLNRLRAARERAEMLEGLK